MTSSRAHWERFSHARAQSTRGTPALMGRTTGTLYLVGAALALSVTVLQPQHLTRLLPVYLAITVALAVGAGLVAFGDRLMAWHYLACVALGTTLITVAVHQLDNPTAALAVATLYIFVACVAAFFFTALWTVAQTALAVVCCVLVLGLQPLLPWWSGLVTAGATIAVSVVVAMLGRSAADADVDSLTGLLNRRGFDRALDHEIRRAPVHAIPTALALLSVDRFSAINERFGYHAGDTVLTQLAGTWRRQLSGSHIIARYGGDEFAILMPHTTEREACQLADLLRAVVPINCSAAVTSLQPGETASTLMQRAGSGLHRAKRSGRNRTVLEAALRPPPATELAAAIADDGIDVCYQPIVGLTDASVVGFEALVRWTSTSQPDLTPEEIVRLAEENDLIARLDRAVLRRACADSRELQKSAPDRAMMLNVNVSGLELADEEYVDRVQDILADTGWPAGQLVLEVTESILDTNSTTVIANLQRLRENGIRTAIDDFGTGYSSLSRLQSLPTDYLKLDASFIGSMDTASQSMLRVIALLSGALRLPVIAEGVEDDAQAGLLGELGFQMAQGYYFGRAQTRRDLADHLRAECGRRMSSQTQTKNEPASSPRGATTS